jgi:hypothetical protein
LTPWLPVPALALLAVFPSHAETCKPPDVPRVVIDNTRPTSTTLTVWELACPVEGPCSYKAVVIPQGPQNVICLTPPEHQAALERAQ